jgi:N-acetylmuramoyl-L-alanine amidase
LTSPTRPAFRGLVLLLLLCLPVWPAKTAKPSSRTRRPAKKLSRVAQVKKAQARLARNWYQGLQEPIPASAGAALKGRVIVIDPGHTNCSPGAEGPRRLINEGDLNWQVADNLVRLLTAAGARAVLTEPYGKPKPVAERNTDADLDLRAAVSNRERADLFVSIHHNSSDEPAVNRTEVYYRLEDSGPSRDAANYILIHLTRNLGLDGSLQPANYRVLRVNARPALLTEASYISNPLQESLLNRRDKQLLEAQAIYLGIADYFAHGVPAFRLLTDSTRIAARARPSLAVHIHDRFSPDPASFRASFDGIPAQVRFSPADTTCTVVPAQALTNGRHVFRFAARNTQGNSGIPLETAFTTDREPERITLTASPSPCPPGSFVMEVRACALDHDGQPVADTRRVSFAVDKVALGDSTLRAGQARIRLARAQPGNVTVTATCGKARVTQQFTFAPARTPIVQFRVVRADNRQALGQVLVRDDWTPDSTLTSPDGLATLLPAAGVHDFTFTAPGFRGCDTSIRFAARSAAVCTIRLAPLLGGALIGQRVVLDPAGAWELPDTTAELAAFNLGLAQRLAVLLKLAGAQVQVSRHSGQTISRTERLARAGPFKPDCYLKLSTRIRDPVRQTRVGHYPDSPFGERLAAAIQSRLAALRPVVSPTIIEERSNEVVNAPCPAVGLYLRLRDTAEVTQPQAADRLTDDLARELVLGLAAQRGFITGPEFRLHIADPKGRPLAAARVLLNQLLVYRVDAGGNVAGPLAPGVHSLEVSCPGYRPVRSTIELKPGEKPSVRSLTLSPR